MFSTVIMRVDNHVHVRHIMLYHFEKGWKATESARDINELFGEGTIGERMVQKWFKRFKDGDTSLKDEEGRGRRSDFDDQALLDAVEEDESLNIVIHHDNSRPHVEARVIESIKEKGWDLLQHPLYFPSEAPTDYHINRSLNNWLSNKVYDDKDELVDDV